MDKFEHVLFLETYLGDWAHVGYKFVYNFHPIMRITAGVGVGWYTAWSGHQSNKNDGIRVTPRIGLEIGSKLIRGEFGFRPILIEKNRPAIGVSAGIKSRRFRTFQAAFSWTPVFKYSGSQNGMLNFSGGLEFFIISKKRRAELGPWKGKHPFTSRAQQIERHNEKEALKEVKREARRN